ncbi:hypothetical protein CCR97_29445 [Rhodoplanes elegans]|nr:hypothetical protein [Rhodoplanes elegans]
MPAATIVAYLRATGWTLRPSRMSGISIASKQLEGADGPVELILPETPGFSDEQRRVADALRTVEVVEERPLDEIVRDIRIMAGGARPVAAESVVRRS